MEETAGVPLPVLFEDGDVLAVHKPEGLVSNAQPDQKGLARHLP